ncbi:hypothetical protein N7528_006250 [Penicillium herquei]|nr:hypothetical protein N7528_006250 [Penicillium herquei]
MAASLGATSLDNLHHEGLDELLHELANVYPAGTDHPKPSIGVPILDALMEVFTPRTVGPAPEYNPHTQLNQTQVIPQDPEPVQELIQSDDDEMLLTEDYDNEALSSDEQQVPTLLFSGSAHRSHRRVPVLEISSSLSGAGKSQLLYYLTALAVLPREYGNTHIGGQDAAVVFIDADDRFDVQRLEAVARGIILKAGQSQPQTEQDSEQTAENVKLSSDDLETMLFSAFKHIHILRPQSSSALLATLGTLDTYLYDISQHHSAPRPLQMLAIDSMTAFFWQDKLRDNLARTEDLGRSREENDKLREQNQSFHFVDLYAEIAKELKRLQTRFGCTVVYTTTVSGARPNKSTADQSGQPGPYDAPPSRTPALRSALPAPWGTFPLLRLVVQRDSIRAFPPTMSMNDAKKDAPMRQSVVRRGKFSAYVNSWGREDWPSRVIDGLRPYGDGSFPFYVREDAIEIPLPGS